jgi:hypothetical protein
MGRAQVFCAIGLCLHLNAIKPNIQGDGLGDVGARIDVQPGAFGDRALYGVYKVFA